ncbi:hypothetical protein ABZP36_012363 [Zizania latifolia]
MRWWCRRCAKNSSFNDDCRTTSAVAAAAAVVLGMEEQTIVAALASAEAELPVASDQEVPTVALGLDRGGRSMAPAPAKCRRRRGAVALAVWWQLTRLHLALICLACDLNAQMDSTNSRQLRFCTNSNDLCAAALHGCSGGLTAVQSAGAAAHRPASYVCLAVGLLDAAVGFATTAMATSSPE